jgi:hypothetical protein
MTRASPMALPMALPKIPPMIPPKTLSMPQTLSI